MAFCKPKWHDQLAKQVRPRSQSLGRLDLPECTQRDDGTISCLPEAMRLAVENRLRSAGYLGTDGVSKLTLDAYSLARCIASESASTADVEQRVALGEATYNYSKKRWSSVTQMLTRGGWYASQSGVSPPASSARAPWWEDIVIATMVLEGRTGGFVDGATNYFGPNAFGSEARLQEVYKSWTDGGLRWIGRLPGVPTRQQMFFKSGPKDAAWAAAKQAGLEELALGTSATYVNAETLPPCGWIIIPRSSRIALVGAGVVAAGGLALWAVNRRLS